MSGQFYAVYGNSYQQMSTKPMLKQAWATGELIDQLATMRQAFGYARLARSTPPLATGTQPTARPSLQPMDFICMDFIGKFHPDKSWTPLCTDSCLYAYRVYMVCTFEDKDSRRGRESIYGPHLQ